MALVWGFCRVHAPVKRKIVRILIDRTQNHYRCCQLKKLRRGRRTNVRELGKIVPYLWYKGCLRSLRLFVRICVGTAGRSDKGGPTVYQKHKSLQSLKGLVQWLTPAHYWYLKPRFNGAKDQQRAEVTLTFLRQRKKPFQEKGFILKLLCCRTLFCQKLVLIKLFLKVCLRK